VKLVITPLDTTRECVSNCPNYYFINNTLDTTEYRCVARCPNNTFINSSTDKHCVKSQNCPSGAVGQPMEWSVCNPLSLVQRSAVVRRYEPNVKMCVYYCPKNYYIQNETNNWKCVSDCTGVANRFIDYISMKCVQNCPNGTFAYSNGTCLTKCPTTATVIPSLISVILLVLVITSLIPPRRCASLYVLMDILEIRLPVIIVIRLVQLLRNLEIL
jgi:hypothetical protein